MTTRDKSRGKTWRRTWGGLAWAVVAVSVVFSNHVVVVALTVTAIATSVLAFGLALSTKQGDPDWRRAIPLGWYVGSGIVALGSICRFDVGLAFLMLAGCAVTSPWVLRRRTRSAAAPVEGLRMGELCQAWTDSFVTLGRAASPQEQAMVVDRRQRYLDELARRDPDSFSSWLQSGAAAAGDPAPFFRVSFGEGQEEAA